jgi:uncharacterized membrane protein YvbJ
MRKCVICGEATKFDSYDFCEQCFGSSIEELEEKYEKRASATGKDQQEARSREDSFESPRPI